MRTIWRAALASACVVALGCGGSTTGSAVSATDEAAGENCANGGLRLDFGPDADGDGTPDSVTSTRYVCNGVDGTGATARLSRVTAEPAGDECAEGGVRIDNGPDTDGDGTLDDAEIASTQYVCNGAGGSAGLSTLTRVALEEPGANCAEGGTRIETGVDADGSGALDDTEVMNSSYVCDGESAGGSVMTRAFTSAQLITSGTATLLAQQASITVPGPGRLLAIGSLELYCGSTGAPLCATPLAPSAYVSLSDIAPPDGTAYDAPYSYFTLSPGIGESVTRTEVYDVDAAGTHTYYLYVENGNTSGGGQVGVYRRQITLVFIPN